MRDFQRHIGELYLAKDRRRGVEGTFLWLMEEVGELAEAVRRKDRAALEEEMADVAAWLASLANLLEVDLQAAMEKKYPATCARCGRKPCACAE
ncbi:MAG TPA: MazG nucleotide pyrophosphohydrolase domain-containing protein [Candidatus Thermoplasmatota archaeon]|nr:MazG nucleotide pyrophosphohydrolase domain-containing protein [Candidatus Thermoplasmatota archaeon]